MYNITPRERDKKLDARSYMVMTGCGKMYVTVTHDKNGDMFEVFTHLGKSGQCGSAQLEAICRAVTAGLRCGISPSIFIKQFKGIKCPSPGIDEGHVLSCADAIAYVMEKEYNFLRGNSD